MDVNKIISLILGLLVVILLLVWVNNRFKARRATTTQVKVTLTPTRVVTVTPTGVKNNDWGIFSFLRRSTPTPTMAPTATPTPTLVAQVSQTQYGNNSNSSTSNTTYNNQQVAPMKQIPNTGIDTLFLPSLFSSLGLGVFLSKSKKK